MMADRKNSDPGRYRGGLGTLSGLLSFRNADRVALVGSCLGVASLFLGWYALRPNRLANGVGFSIWQIGTVEGIVLSVFWVLSVMLGLNSVFRWRHSSLALGIVANALLFCTVLWVGLGARVLLAGWSEIARVSLGGGAWLSLAAAWMVLFAAGQNLSGWHKHLVLWPGIASAAVLVAVGWLDKTSILAEYSGYQARFWQEAWQHVRISAISVIIAALIGMAIGVWATRSRVAKGPIFFLANSMQTIPSLALFGILIAPLSALSFAYPELRQLGIRGIGVAPAVIALTIYSLLPVVQNTYTGITRVDRAAIDAGLGMGMTRWQVFLKIEAPLAAPLVLEGVRTASVQAIGLTTVAAIIGAGGLGWFVFRGIGQAAPDLILLGTIPIIVMALLVDGLMRTAVRLGTPKGISVVSDG